jgi:hypothetical protein
MICELLLWTETDKGNIKRTREALREMGLVPARGPNSQLNNDVMVWEDPQENIGRYRVHLYEKIIVEEGGQYDIINFHYWGNKRSLKREIIEQEPMDLAVQKVLPVLEGKIEIQNWNSSIMPLKKALEEYFPKEN